MKQHVQIDYTNHRGERAMRLILPTTIYFGTSLPFHPVDSWILVAYDLNKNATRHFLLSNIHSWVEFGKKAGAQ